MATATRTPAAHAGEIKFQYGAPETFALKFLEPKVFDGQYGPRGMFTACDEGVGERKIWLDYNDARNIVDELQRLGVRVGEPIRVTKVKHPRGGGHGFHVHKADAVPAGLPAWVSDAAAPAASELETQLAQSVRMVAQHGPAVFQRPAATQLAPAAAAPEELTPNMARFSAAYKDAIDVLLNARSYAQFKGLALEIRCEDVRALAATITIDAQRAGGR
jgi:hypothetical protein